MTGSKKSRLYFAATAATLYLALSCQSALASTITTKSMGTFTRVEVKDAKNVSISKKDDTIILNFPSGNAPDPKSLGAGFSRFAESIDVGENRKSIIITLNGEYRLRQFIGNRSSGFDLFASGPKKPKAKPEAKVEPKENPSEPQTSTEAAVKTEEPAKTVEAVKPIEEPKKEISKKEEAKKIEPKKEVEKAVPASPVAASPAAEQKPEQAPAVETKAPETAPTTPATTEPQTKAAEPVITEAPHEEEPRVAAPTSSYAESEAASFRQKAKPLADFRSAKTVFSFPEKSTYAVYERSGNIWVFIENSATTESEGSSHAIEENSYPAEWLQANYGNTTLYWAQMDPNSSIITSINSGQLEVSFTKDQAQKPFQAGIYSYQEGSSGPISALKINFLPPYGINKITDPIAGDNLIIISGETPSAANKRERNTAELQVLKSYSGLAIVSAIDDISAEPMQDGVLMKSPTPFITVKGLMVDSEKPGTRIEKRQSFIPAADWMFPEGKNYMSSRHENNIKFMNSPRESRPFFRLRGAQDFVATGMYSEALGLLKTIKPDTPEFYKKNRLAGLSGTLNLFHGRYEDAVADLSEPEVKDLPEAQMLSKMAALAMNKPEGDSFSFPEAYASFISSYPPRIQKRLAEICLRTLYKKNNLPKTEALMKYLMEEKIFAEGDPQKKLLDYIDSKMTEASGDITAAKKIWEKLAGDLEEREFRAKATNELVRRAYMDGSSSRADTLQKYQNLRYTWREEDFEVPLLETISGLAQEEKDYYSTLESLRYMVAYYPDNENSKKAVQKMSELFINLFNNGGVGKMNPLDALTLYYEFRELTPLGEVGDEMIRNLADRLMEVDLLDRASALLTHQIRFRLEGLPRAQVATRLALIHIMNAKPQNAIEVLDFSNMEGLPADLVENRKLIRAQALMDLKKYQEVLELLAGDTSEKAVELKIETLWNGKMWTEVAKQIEPQLEEAAKSGKPFGEMQEHNLIRLAVAYIMNANAKAAQDLEQKYGKFVTSKDLQTELQFLASDPEGVDHNSMDKLSHAISEFQSFMDNFKKKVKDQGLSKAVP